MDMTLKTTLVIGVLVAYLLFLGTTAWRLAQKTDSNREYLFGSGFGAVLSLFGIAASLFSTFTLQGMPDFFRNHGIASWVFLGITDVCLAALLLYFGLKMRRFTRRLAQKNGGLAPKNLTEWLKQGAMPRWSVLFFVVATTLFMIPYVTIGIKGSALLLNGAVPLGDTHLLWSVIIVLLMLTYSWFGGIRALFITDVVQGLMLMVTVWAIALFAIKGAGGMTALFDQVAAIEPALLTAPGPVGLLNWQFLLVSFISIVLIPYVQPQMATRVLVAKDDKTFARSAMGLAVFALLVILPTVFIGMRAVTVNYGVDLSAGGHFLLNVIDSDAPLFFFALFIVGALAADMSTVDSQLLSIGTEWRSATLKGDIQQSSTAKMGVKIAGIVVAGVALVLAQTSFESLILFAINSFIGTSLLLPMVVAATVQDSGKKTLLSLASLVSVVVFLLILFGVMPNMLAGVRVELILYAVLGALIWWATRSSDQQSSPQREVTYAR